MSSLYRDKNNFAKPITSRFTLTIRYRIRCMIELEDSEKA